MVKGIENMKTKHNINFVFTYFTNYMQKVKMKFRSLFDQVLKHTYTNLSQCFNINVVPDTISLPYRCVSNACYFYLIVS
jgi:hypothetical protein